MSLRVRFKADEWRVDKPASFAALLAVAGDGASRVFDHEGVELSEDKDIEVLGEDALVHVSAGEDFKALETSKRQRVASPTTAPRPIPAADSPMDDVEGTAASLPEPVACVDLVSAAELETARITSSLRMDKFKAHAAAEANTLGLSDVERAVCVDQVCPPLTTEEKKDFMDAKKVKQTAMHDKAVRAIVGALRDAETRANIQIACGGGKTRVGVRATEALVADLASRGLVSASSDPLVVVVLVPSLALLPQTAREWHDWTTREGEGCPFVCEAMSVCSLATLHNKKVTQETLSGKAAIEAGSGMDEAACAAELEMLPASWSAVARTNEHRTAADELRGWLEAAMSREAAAEAVRPRVQLVLSTYHSADQVAAALYALPGASLGTCKRATLTIFDEAHVTARKKKVSGGLSERVDFTRALNEFRKMPPTVSGGASSSADAGSGDRLYGLGSERRLFMTATPRVPAGTKVKRRKAEEEEEPEEALQNMDNTLVYGKRVFSCPMEEAIADGLIRDYVVCVIGFRPPEEGEASAVELMRVKRPVKGKRKLAEVDEAPDERPESDERPEASSVATCQAQLLAMTAAMHRRGLHKGFMFFSTIDAASAARQVADDLWSKGAFKQCAPDAKRLFGVVHSKQSPAESKLELQRFSEATRESTSLVLMFNVRSLGVGVNVPDAQAEGIVSGQTTLEGLTQAIGRVLRHDEATACQGAALLLPLAITGSADGEPTDYGGTGGGELKGKGERKKGKPREDPGMVNACNVLAALKMGDSRLDGAFRKLKRGHAVFEKGGGDEKRVEALEELRRFVVVEAEDEEAKAEVVRRLRDQVYDAELERTSTAVGIDEALDALEAEVEKQRVEDPRWRISQKHEQSDPTWDPKWKAGSWVAARWGQGKQAQGLRNAMTQVQLDRLDNLPYGKAFTVDEALDALDAEVKKQREENPGWGIIQKHRMCVPWDENWNAGTWVSIRWRDSRHAQKMRDGMSQAQRDRLDELPYGKAFTIDQALDALEAEVKKQRETDPSWRILFKHFMSAPWGDPEWQAGSWVSSRWGKRLEAQNLCNVMSGTQRDRLMQLPYGATFTTEEALDALEAEVEKQRETKSTWQFSAKHVMAAPWLGECGQWNAGGWIMNRRGESEAARRQRGDMTKAQQDRFKALPYGTGCDIDEALEALEGEVKKQRETDPRWRIGQKHTMKVPWDENWKAGTWVSSRVGDSKQKVAMREKMTPAQKERVDALPYGTRFSIDEALDALEAEVKQQRNKDPRWRINAKHEINAPFDPKWKAGSWLSKQPNKIMTQGQQDRLKALPYGSKYTTDEALEALEAEVKKQMEEDPTWRIRQTYTMWATWDDNWRVGSWVSNRRGESEAARRQRGDMTKAQQDRFNALPYGTGCDIDEALEALEGEVKKQRETDPRWRIGQKHTMKVPWDENWKAGTWVSSRVGDSEQRVAMRNSMTKAQRDRFKALPYGRAGAV